jgi:hypothetical protein
VSPLLTPRRQSLLVRLLQLLLVGIAAVGVRLGNPGVAVNAGIGLLASFVPALLRRNYGFTLGPGIALWITAAVFLHALGTLPLPGLNLETLYGTTWWWDHMTHALSSSIVAGVAYAVARALDEYTDAINMPPRFMFVYLLVFVMAFGVVWELLEFYISVVADLLGGPTLLTQYGLDDTVLDLIYNSVGGLLVALYGGVRLTGVSEQLRARLEGRGS